MGRPVPGLLGGRAQAAQLAHWIQEMNPSHGFFAIEPAAAQFSVFSGAASEPDIARFSLRCDEGEQPKVLFRCPLILLEPLQPDQPGEVERFGGGEADGGIRGGFVGRGDQLQGDRGLPPRPHLRAMGSARGFCGCAAMAFECLKQRFRGMSFHSA